MHYFKDLIYNWLVGISDNEFQSKFLTTLIVGVAIALIAFLCFYITRKFLIAVIHRIAEKTAAQWDDILVKRKFFHALSHLVPASILYFEANFANDFFPVLESYLIKASEIYFLFAFILIINSLLTSMNDIYNSSFSSSKERPISGVIQFLKIILYFISLLILISIVFNKDLVTLFTGLGAVAAILLLVFKDSILGLTASMQISMNDMVKIGDWIEMPSKGADGTVTEINLTTVKVENWDKTISNIPTYSLVSESFINWKGMENAGGRRIKRSINIDITSVKFCTQEMLDKFQQFVLIKEYVTSKQQEIEEFNKKLDVPAEQNYNGRRQTNLGVFRKYLEAYLHNHPMINQEMTFLVRHLQPTEKGIPVEIYVFSKDKAWARYEAIQADIFDHILAVIPKFELRIFQNPTGADINSYFSALTSDSTGNQIEGNK